MEKQNKWLELAVELQSLAQAGLTYANNDFDIERFSRIREISAEIVSDISDVPYEKVVGLFCNEVGYQTPKIDTRASIFQDDKILLVKEKDGRWSLPGGWCDVNISVGENTIKEVKEEAGLDVVPEKVVAIQDRAKHNVPIYAYGVCKIFIECSLIGGEFKENIETVECRYFSEDDLPPLSEEKNNEEQIKMCFRAYRSKNWKTLFD